MMNTFFYKDEQEIIFSEESEMYVPMEDVLTHVARISVHNKLNNFIYKITK